MRHLNQKGTFKILWVTALAWFIAQSLKVLIYWYRTHKINFRLFVGTGGMPSSHSAFAACLATTIGLESGWGSPVFMLSLGVAIIIMSDAAGVRRAAGLQAKILNQIIGDLYRSRPVPPQRLKELIGHTPVQVIVGALIGIFIALGIYSIVR